MPKMPFGQPMGIDPSQPIADSSGQYRSVAGANPAPSMSVAPKPIPQVSTTAETIARRMASKQSNEPAADQFAATRPKKKKKSLMELFMEMEH